MFDCTALNDEKLSCAFSLPFTSSTPKPCSYTVKYPRTHGISRDYGVLSESGTVLVQSDGGESWKLSPGGLAHAGTGGRSLEDHGRRDSRGK